MVCPICNGKDLNKLFEIRRTELGKNISYNIWMCRSCTFRYAEGPLTETVLSQIYNEGFYTSSQQYAPVDVNGEFTAESLKFPVIRNALARIEFLREIGADGDLLDIGAARGYFVKVASKIFNAEGIELNPEAAASGALMNIKIIPGNFLTHDFGEKKFNVITMWDVLASLPQPKVTIAKVYSLLKREGLLVMTLPDGSSIPARLLRKYWPLMIPPVNLGFYTCRSIEKLLTAHNFKIKHISFDAKIVSIDFLLHKLFRTLRLKVLANVKLPIDPSFSVPLNIRDIMTVVAIRGDT